MSKSTFTPEPESFFSSPQKAAPKTRKKQEEPDDTSATAIVYCEGAFATDEGSYTTRLLQHSEKYRVLSVIDSQFAGQDTGTTLGEDPHGIPLRTDLTEAINLADRVPNAFLIGVERTESKAERKVILEAIGKKLTIVNAWLPFLSDDPEFVEAAKKHEVSLIDLQKPKPDAQLQTFTGKIKNVTCPIVAVLGTDTDLGERETAINITRTLNKSGIRTTMVSTGQAGLTQGARYGVVLESLPEKYQAGELEAIILKAFETEHPDIIIVEGQGALSHQENTLATALLKGASPSGIVVQHAPKRKQRASNPELTIQPLSKEITLIEEFADAQNEVKVIGVTLNPENMATAQLDAAIVWLESNLERPVIAPLSQPSARLVKMVADACPKIKKKLEGAVVKEKENEDE